MTVRPIFLHRIAFVDDRTAEDLANEDRIQRADTCCTGDCDQGRTCPLYAPDEPETANGAGWWVAAVILLAVLCALCYPA